MRALAAAGHDVDFTYRASADAAAALAADLTAAHPGRQVVGHALDLAERSEIDGFCEAIEDERFFGHVLRRRIVRDERPYGGRVPPAVVYRYSPDRKGEHPRAHLAKFRGFLQADGYSGFGPLYGSANGQLATVTEVACWAHVRRKFYDIHVATSAPIAGEALQRIGQLFDIERAAMARSADERRRIRQLRARPVIDDLAAFLDASLSTISGRSELAGAIRYARSRWSALTRYLDDGSLEISNNAAERAIRPLALDRKNYMFAGSDAGGERAAAAYTLIDRQAPWPQPRSLLARSARTHCRPPDQPRRRALALESRQGLTCSRRSLTTCTQVKQKIRSRRKTLTVEPTQRGRSWHSR